MILKVQKDELGSWKLFNDVVNPEYEYYLLDELDKQYTNAIFPTCKSYSFISNEATKGNFALIKFQGHDGYYVVACNMPCYLMNDKGETVQRVRY